MRYNKPTVEVLDEAVRVIQGNKLTVANDGSGIGPDAPPPPAYELDE